MKFQICSWTGESIDTIEKLGYKDREFFDGNVFEVAKQFVEVGLKVMISNQKDFYLLAIDTRMFSQR
jgi:hypothetical protein